METVTKCTKLRDWTKDGKSVPIYEIQISDGQVGESFGKEIPTGTPLDQLSLENGQYGLKIKWNNPNKPSGFSGRQRSGNESFSLAYAKDILVASWTGGKSPKALSSDEMFSIADKMFEWLEKKKK
jgi:hypothetical protein